MLFNRIISRKTFLAAGVAGLAGAWAWPGRAQAEAEALPADASWPLVREWVANGQIGRRLWVQVDCPSSFDHAQAICPALYACNLDRPLHVSALGETHPRNALPPRFLMTARYPGGHTLVLNVTPDATARTTIRGEHGDIDIRDDRICIEETGSETNPSGTALFGRVHEGRAQWIGEQRFMACATETLDLGARALSKG